MIPIQALIVNHFILMARFGLLNSWAGIVMPQLIHPVVVIVYKQFFDGVPRTSARRRSWTMPASSASYSRCICR